MQAGALQAKRLTKDKLFVVSNLAHTIWPVSYKSIITDAQIEFMLRMMYSPEKLLADYNRGDVFLGLYDITHSEALFQPAYGYSQIGMVDDLKAKLHKLYVLPTLHGSGLGKTLLSEAENIARSLEAKDLILNVNKANPAYHFYLHYGFTVAYQEVIDIGGGFVMDDYVMTKPLT